MKIGKITERIDAITRISEERRVSTPPCPRSVKVELAARRDSPWQVTTRTFPIPDRLFPCSRRSDPGAERECVGAASGSGNAVRSLQSSYG
jgi:hypothetical protein